VATALDSRSLSSVDDLGNRAVLPGKYSLTLAAAQPQETDTKTEVSFTVAGSASLPK
jgi:hypothetical protein